VDGVCCRIGIVCAINGCSVEDWLIYNKIEEYGKRQIVHIQRKVGIFRIGINLIKQTAINIKSAMESSLEPNSLTEFVSLAMVPSIISVNPAIRYRK